MTQVSGSAPTRGRGRPARLSRDQIVDAAVALVYEDPATPLTIKRVAEAADSAPMALYRYFPDRDDLLHAVADRVATGMSFEPPVGASWREQLRNWMTMSMEYLRPYPQLLPYIASTRQPAWLPSFVLLTEMLEPLSLGEQDLALAITLIGTTIVGQATLASKRRPMSDMLPTLRQALDKASADEQVRVAPILDALPAAFGRLDDVVIESTIAAVEALSPKGGGAGRASKRGRKGPMNPLFSNPSPA
ncbi:TetR/AcrR family transcriptional regulator [Streptodolium elevatio]